MTQSVEAPGPPRPWPARAMRVSIAVILGSLVALAAIAWILTARTSAGMGAEGSMGVFGIIGDEAGMHSMSAPMGPAVYLGMWVVMMVAMMFPSVAPMVVSHWRISAQRGQGPLALPVFVLGYLAAWTAVGAVAYVLYRGALLLAGDLPAPVASVAAGAVLLIAGAYQFTRFKTICLRHCRGPLEFFLQWKPGVGGAARMGTEHGLYCVGCCWSLMLVLFGIGLANIAWMGVIAAVIFLEKIAPFGERAAKAVGVAIVVAGILVAAGPYFEGVRFVGG